ncbi:predicted protein [Thalassiosira pseudonana CCMP1335]|uniref:TauD/TfdA-like domain-containing protein n=1 Tax=Thalassiosira pseudonana TaxID=35128 RepID=B5YP61_THAPS|nr:predicted protein [Thalassiosira pseudonana CCMP1335]ACI64401.1 predicted protein [Thalassiosira pseudonana CCMP1335]
MAVQHHHRRQLNIRYISINIGTRPPLPLQFLGAYDAQKFDQSTHQRNDIPFDPVNGKPPPSSSAEASPPSTPGCTWEYDSSTDKWSLPLEGNTSSNYSNEWVQSQLQQWRMDPTDFDVQWNADNPTGNAKHAQEANHATKRVLWSNWTADMIRDPSVSPILFQYDNLRSSENNSNDEKRLLKTLHQYGLVLIRGTPTSTDSLPRGVMNEASLSLADTSDTQETAESAILHLASLIGYHPLHTLYGSGVWSTSSHSSFYNKEGDGNDTNDESGAATTSASASTADSAYGSTSLPLHTDMTYMGNPPGVQVFLMVQPASNATTTSGNDTSAFTPKGQSVYLDGFAAAKQLLLENPEAYNLLATTQRRYRCVDNDEGWHLEASGPVIDAAPRWRKANDAYEWGPVKSIRHNDLDRLPDLPPYFGNETSLNDSRNDSFYRQLQEAHEAWDNILRRDSLRLVIDLQPGECVLVANQRCMHGRYSFEASKYPRVVMGCYVGMDELLSKWRRNGLRVI